MKKLLIILMLLLTTFSYAGSTPVITEEDGDPFCRDTGKLKFSNGAVTCNRDGSVSISVSTIPHWQASHTETTTTDGGSSTATTWTQLKFNTEDFDDLTVTLSSNRLTLPAGTYWFDVTHVFYGSGKTRLRIYNVTDAAVEATGMGIFGNGTSKSGIPTSVKGKVILAAQKTIEIQYYLDNADALGLGRAVSDGATEVYGYWNVTKQ